MCKFSVPVCLIGSPVHSAIAVFLFWVSSPHLSPDESKLSEIVTNSGNQSATDFS